MKPLMQTQHQNQQSNIDDLLESARNRYIDQNPNSLSWHEQARNYMPGGNTRTVLFHSPFPLRIQSGAGNQINDADDHEYTNFLGEYTAGLFGHSNPVIRSAIDRALDRGISLSGHNEDEVTLANLICDRFPSIQKVRFTNSGTEANLLSISAARYFTGRSKVMVFEGGYHGGLLYFRRGGMPLNAPFDYAVGHFNDFSNTQNLIEKNASDLACILVEPMQGASGCIPGDQVFLQMLREISQRHGILLIFDEVMTSRLADTGYQGLTNILPDMTTLGKYIGGGMSFGAFGGRDDVMAMFDPTTPQFVPHAGTFNNNSLTMAAGVAAMRDVITSEALSRINHLGNQLRDRLNRMFSTHGLRLQVTGKGSLLAFHSCLTEISSIRDLDEEDDRLMEILFLGLLENGFYIARRGFVALMLTITESDVDRFCSAVEKVVLENQSVFAKH